MPEITADEARDLMRENRDVNIEKYTEVLDDRIREAAEANKNCIDLHRAFDSVTVSPPSGNDREAVDSYYAARGFKVTDHPDPDPGHPASRPYTTISW